jgi:hypothetical protein
MISRPSSKGQKEAALMLEQGLDPDDIARNIINEENRNRRNEMVMMPRQPSFSATTTSPTSNCKEDPDNGGGGNFGDDEDGDDEDINFPGFHSVDALKKEIDRMRNDKIQSIEEIEHHKKRVTYGIVLALFSFCFGISMIAWKFSENKPTYSELRQELISPPHERPRICQTVYPFIYSKQFDPSIVGESLILTDYLDGDDPERIAQGASKARVDDVLQSEISFSGFLRVNNTYNSSLVFWFFPARSKPAESPLLLWLEGGPGWPTTYALFKVGV